MEHEFLKHIDLAVSPEIESFVDENVFGESEYMFFENKPNGIEGFCSKCKQHITIENKVKHNDWTVCPICGAHVTLKNRKLGRGNCLNRACFYYFEKSKIDPSIELCKGMYVERSYEEWLMPKTSYFTAAVYIFDTRTGKAEMLTHNYSYYYGETWSERKTIHNFNTNWYSKFMCYISHESRREAFKDTCLQYIPEELFDGYSSSIKIIEQFLKYPWLEQVYKLGLHEVVESRFSNDSNYYCFNFKEKNPYKIIKLDKMQVKSLVNAGFKITPRKLALYQLAVKSDRLFPAEEIDRFDNRYGFNFFRFKEILKFTSFGKAIRYLDKQEEKKKSSSGSLVIMWADYLQNARELLYDMKDEHVLFPKDVVKAHDYTVKQVKIADDSLTNIKIGKRAEAINEKYFFEDDNFILRSAASVKDLVNEGTVLGHCVATNYTKKYANGETNILFVRRKKEMDKPFYTMELKNNSIIQLRGSKNCSPTDEVKLFIEKFKNTKLQKHEKIRVAV